MIVELLALAGSAAAQCAPASEADVRQEFNAWVGAYQAHDLAGTMAIFAPEIRFEFQGAPDASWSDLKQSYAQEFARPGGLRWVPHWDEIRVSTNIAAAFSQWQAFLTRADGTKELRATNRSVDVLRRGADCRWRIVRSLNYPVRPPPAVK